MFIHNKFIALFLITVFLLTSGLSCKLGKQDISEAMKPITLTYWRVWDGPDAFDEIIKAYQEIHPNIKINYVKLRYSEYEQKLLEALAEDRGPDIFSIHNTWIRKYDTKIEPMPAQITLIYPVEQGAIKKEIVAQPITTKSITLKELKNNFLDVVYDDVVIDGKIYGLPLAVDTLAMYYNKDLFNNAGIITPPKYWNREFQQAVTKLTKQDVHGNIIQSGVALGGSSNIERYSDILSVLMMQNGATMLSDTGQIMFNLIPPALKEQGYNPGLEALRFYTDFSNPAKEVYSWNKDLDNSLDSFIQGKVGMMFGYAYNLPTIKARAPKLNFGIAKLPQIEGGVEQINFANYWVETVSKKSKHIDEAWDFIQFATKKENVRSYLEATKKPTALRSLISEQIDDLDIGTFAEQLLTAKSWYKGEDSNAMERIFKDMIDRVVNGEGEIIDIINIAANQVQQTIR